MGEPLTALVFYAVAPLGIAGGNDDFDGHDPENSKVVKGGEVRPDSGAENSGGRSAIDDYDSVQAMSLASISLHKARHLLSHVLVVAGSRRWPQTTLGDSGETETGFYADFGLSVALDESELATLNDEMARVLRDFKSFRDLQLTPEQALKVFGNHPWKLHQVAAIAEVEARIGCFELDGVIDVCDCALKSPGELHAVHPEKFLLTGSHPVVWSHRGKESLFVRITGELLPAPAPCA